MKTLCAVLCIAIVFVAIVEPQRSNVKAGDEAAQVEKQGADTQVVTSLADTVGRLVDQSMELSAAIAEVKEKTVSRDEVTRLVTTTLAEQPPAPAANPGQCKCECDCDQQLAAMGNRLASLEQKVAELEKARTAVVVSPTHAAVQRPAPVKAIAKAATAPIARAGHWTYPGEISQHLASGHGVSAAGMTREQMLDLHDALHEGRASAPVSQPVVTRVAPIVQYGGCPGGVCPTSGGCPGGVCPTQGYSSRGGGLLGFGVFGRR